MIPVVLLDVDGVLNAVTRDNPSTFPDETWSVDICRGFAIRWSTVVRDFILELHELAEVRWHTTWQNEAKLISDALGLPMFPVADAPEIFAYKSLGWWKMGAALRVVNEEGRDLIWLDDDLSRRERETFSQNRERGQAFLVRPNTLTGLNQANIDGIRGFLSRV